MKTINAFGFDMDYRGPYADDKQPYQFKKIGENTIYVRFDNESPCAVQKLTKSGDDYTQEWKYTYWNSVTADTTDWLPINQTFTVSDNPPIIYRGLCFTAEEAGSTIFLNQVQGTYQTSTDGDSWTDYTLGDTITLAKAGDKVLFAAKTTNANVCTDSTNMGFVMGGKISASGDVMSLFDKNLQTTTVPQYGLRNLFYNCTALVTAPQISMVRTSYECCDSMFEGCTSLVTAPYLGATVITNRCYANMFKGCSSLSIAENSSEGTIVLNLPSGAGTQYWNSDMFKNTKGPFTGNPQGGNVYKYI